MNYQICSHCVMDTVQDPHISFNKEGVCNYCVSYKEKYIDNALSDQARNAELDAIVQKIKAIGEKKKYDCILGLSGGVDSSYLALKAKEMGLRCLLVHFDNGWNSELAVHNIEKIAKYTGFDLYTYVVDWDEFRELQLAYIKSSVIDWEIPTDHGFYATLHKIAFKYKITSILAGFNHQTEAILPSAWNWRKSDYANIEDIFKKHGNGRLKTFPSLGFFKALFYDKFNRISVYSLLEYMDYDKNKAKAEIIERMEWEDYGGKHYESIFTRFYQGFILPVKYNVDKRRAHLSSLICSGQMTRDEALAEIATPPYEPNMLLADTAFFKKKFALSDEEFDKILKHPVKSHLDFKSYETGLYPRYFRIIKYWTKLKSVLR